MKDIYRQHKYRGFEFNTTTTGSEGNCYTFISYIVFDGVSTSVHINRHEYPPGKPLQFVDYPSHADAELAAVVMMKGEIDIHLDHI